ncbi:MAG TPA: hypothetical protein VHM30_19725 [Gemmatimonadaceae bacterium]|nr:hypothetical protein [Gemmatimonadaceae bacterium]
MLLRCLGLLIALSLAGSRLAAAQDASGTRSPVVPLGTAWPSVTAIDIVSLSQFHHFQVSASTDGWVAIAALDIGGERYPRSRMYVTGGEALEWAGRVRAVLSRALTGTARSDSATLQLPVLGRGAGRMHGSRLDPFGGEWQRNLSFGTCSYPSIGYDVSDAAWLRMADVVERAARVAVAARPEARAPTLDRPYYASEVGCPATGRGENAEPPYPKGARARVAYEVGMQLVVDTAGRVEAGSIEVLPGTDSVFARAARTTVAGWRFTRAWWAAWPVRQVVHLVITFDPGARPWATVMHRGVGGRYEPRMLFDGTTSGWVIVRHGSWTASGSFTGGREWYEPDTMRAWLAQLERRLREDRRSPKIWRRGSDGRYIGLGTDWRRGPRLMAGYPGVPDVRDSVTPPDSVMRLRAHLAGCGAAFIYGELVNSGFLARIRRATRAAERNRSSPAPIADRVYGGSEVACPAQILHLPLADGRFPDARIEPFGPRSPALDEAHARAEVMTSFVVDTLGRIVRGTLSVMPGSDFRAAAALEQQIDRYDFTPAYRSGKRVRQRVIRSWLFVPAPVCERDDSGIDCPRRYASNEARRLAARDSAAAVPRPPAPPPLNTDSLERVYRGCYSVSLLASAADPSAIDTSRRLLIELDSQATARPNRLEVAPGITASDSAPRWNVTTVGRAGVWWTQPSSSQLILIFGSRESDAAYILVRGDSTRRRLDGSARVMRIPCAGARSDAARDEPVDPAVVTELDATLDSAAASKGVGTLTVNVVWGPERRPATHGRVEIHGRRGPVAPTKACDYASAVVNVVDGSAYFRCLPAGEYTLHAMGVAFRRNTWRVRVRAGYADTVTVRLLRETCDLAC